LHSSSSALDSYVDYLFAITMDIYHELSEYPFSNSMECFISAYFIALCIAFDTVNGISIRTILYTLNIRLSFPLKSKEEFLMTFFTMQKEKCL